MYHVTVPMGLMDFIPVLFFGIAALLLLKDFYGKMGPGAFALFAAGSINIFTAGFLKALWKLLYAAGVCDFQALNTMFLPVQSIGFLLAGLGMVLMMAAKKKDVVMMAAPPVFSGSFVFIMMMVLGLGSICTVLSIIAAKMKKKSAMVLIILSFVCSMGMGAMAGQDPTQAWYHWTEQGINCVGQGLLMGGVLVLHKAGLANYDWRKKP